MIEWLLRQWEISKKEEEKAQSEGDNETAIYMQARGDTFREVLMYIDDETSKIKRRTTK